MWLRYSQDMAEIRQRFGWHVAEMLLRCGLVVADMLLIYGRDSRDVTEMRL